VELFIIRVKLAIYYFLHFNKVRQVAARLRAKSAIYDCFLCSGVEIAAHCDLSALKSGSFENVLTYLICRSTFDIERSGMMCWCL